MIYTALKPENPDLSLATVYRNLRDFCADGMAVSLGVINGHERFDADTSPHSHFVCRGVRHRGSLSAAADAGAKRTLCVFV